MYYSRSKNQQIIQSKTFCGVILLTLLTLGIWLRWIEGVGRDLWYDELVIWKIATQPKWQAVILAHRTSNSAPILYAFLVRLASFALGNSEPALRVPSFMAGILSIAISYFSAKGFFTRPVAILTSALVAFSASQIQYSSELREYSLTVTLSFSLFYSFNALISHSNPQRYFTLFLVLITLALWTQYGLAVLVSGILLLYLFLSWRQHLALNKGAIAMIVAFMNVLLIYWLILRYQFRIGFGPYLANSYLVTERGFIAGLLQLLGNTSDLIKFAAGSDIGGILLSLAFVSGLTSILLDCKQRKPKLFLAITGYTWLAIFMLAILRMYPYGGVRQDILLTPMIYIIASFGVVSLFRHSYGSKFLSMTLLAGVFVASCHFLVSDSSWVPKEQFSEVASFLKQKRSESEPIYVTWSGLNAFEYYYSTNDVGITFKGGLHTNVDLVTLDNCITEGDGKCWLVYSHCESCGKFVSQLPANYVLVSGYRVSNRTAGAFLIGSRQMNLVEEKIDDFDNLSDNWKPHPANNIEGEFSAKDGALRLGFFNRKGIRDIYAYGYYFEDPPSSVSSLTLRIKLEPGTFFTVDVKVSGQVIDPRFLNYYTSGANDWEAIRVPIPEGDFEAFWVGISEPPNFSDQVANMRVQIDWVKVDVTKYE
jgi:hypothetical protein